LLEDVKGKLKLVENARKSFQLDMRALPRAQQTDYLTVSLAHLTRNLRALPHSL
jgi:hypothetical protein